jgi:hypothetical protein
VWPDPSGIDDPRHGEVAVNTRLSADRTAQPELGFHPAFDEQDPSRLEMASEVEDSGAQILLLDEIANSAEQAHDDIKPDVEIERLESPLDQPNVRSSVRGKFQHLGTEVNTDDVVEHLCESRKMRTSAASDIQECPDIRSVPSSLGENEIYFTDSVTPPRVMDDVVASGSFAVHRPSMAVLPTFRRTG